MMRPVIAHVAHASAEFKHPFLTERPAVRGVGYIVVSTDRGLCGGLNSNLFRRLLGEIRTWQEQGVEVDVVCIGQKAVQFFRRLKVNMVGSVTHLGAKPQVAQLIGVIKVVLDAYNDGRIDRLSIAYNDFVNTMTQRPTITPLLPLPPSEDAVATHAWDYLYEPDAETVLDHVLTRYIESLVYQAVLENLASEHAARMVAMKSASDNATKAIGSLTLVYNKARQAAITQEISEIVGGAAAV
jgi:F-type H+-transporting ATPase subunit gamma